MEKSDTEFYEDYINEMIENEVILSQAIFFANLSMEERMVATLAKEISAAIDNEIISKLRGSVKDINDSFKNTLIQFEQLDNSLRYNEIQFEQSDDKLICNCNFQLNQPAEYIELNFTIDNTSSLGETVDISDLESDAK